MNCLEFQTIVGDLQFQDWTFEIGDMGEGFYLQVQFKTADNQTGELTIQRGRKWYISRHMTRGEVIQTAFLAVKTAQEHELREQFIYRGRAVFGPHFSVNALIEICDQERVELRKEAP
jgi:hypothetical protein